MRFSSGLYSTNPVITISCWILYPAALFVYGYSFGMEGHPLLIDCIVELDLLFFEIEIKKPIWIVEIGVYEKV